MNIDTTKKGYINGTHRVISPKETLEKIEPLKDDVGITRVADITGLDRVGIPVYSSIRPTAEKGAISVYNGKGSTEAEAKASAIMEGIERYSSELHDRELVLDSYSNLTQKTNVLDPRTLILPETTPNPLMARISWIKGYDMMQDEEIYVPANAVFHPLSPGKKGSGLFQTNTNGLASGNILEEAVFHGLTEVIERDAWSLAEAARDTGPKINLQNQEINKLIEKFEQQDISIIIRDLTNDIGIPTFAAVSEDNKLQDPALLTIGMGTHTDARVAIKRAITEVAQSRATQIHGAREDTLKGDNKRKLKYKTVKNQNKHWFNNQNTKQYQNLEKISYIKDDFIDDISHTLKQLNKNGIQKAIFVNLTLPELEVPVVRVIIPGLEVFAVDPERIGRRCHNARQKGSCVRGAKPQT
ncbi:Ribosomal protein S12 methylthiotransferase accessory factor YcaO [Methanonatronarchaeum thermophilum]|uniref:Ribosomal protein S12 methylthiotransferase accessory factor YcaO n=1 Tax=Methanonatronarchaeum thermophilum TaxID=1927129 RepID=A0A1Y3GDJ3_9EURY|nr:YcaO-related McrA-glycine thioamidation protein [Methanonatronarchaeum thermophilum]OUJ19297.1 Ribosomal protein S12 methylthiotransferase accessory factor YcaO [Methanonatronarchaeum thermophilum]